MVNGHVQKSVIYLYVITLPIVTIGKNINPLNKNVIYACNHFIYF